MKLKIFIAVLVIIALFAINIAYYKSSSSWCVSGKIQGPCNEWPMKDVPESMKYHAK